MTADPNGWDGRPKNPERDGAHWLDTPGGVVTATWIACVETWYPANSNTSSHGYSWRTADKRRWRYLDPCLTPAEVAALQAAAFQRGAEAMREKLASAIARLDPVECDVTRGECLSVIRALPIPEPDHDR